MRNTFFVAIAAFMAAEKTQGLKLEPDYQDWLLSQTEVESFSEEIENFMKGLEGVYEDPAPMFAQTDAGSPHLGLPGIEQVYPMVQPFLPMISHLSDQQIIHGLGRLGHMSDGNVCATAKNMFNLEPAQLVSNVRSMASMWTTGHAAQW